MEIPFPPFATGPGPYETSEGAKFRISATFTVEIDVLAAPGTLVRLASMLSGRFLGTEAQAVKGRTSCSARVVAGGAGLYYGLR